MLASPGDGKAEGRYYALSSARCAPCSDRRYCSGSIVSGGCGRGDAAVRQAGQQSRKSPDSVRFLRYLQIAEVFFRPSPGLLASAPRSALLLASAPSLGRIASGGCWCAVIQPCARSKSPETVPIQSGFCVV